MDNLSKLFLDSNLVDESLPHIVVVTFAFHTPYAPPSFLARLTRKIKPIRWLFESIVQQAFRPGEDTPHVLATYVRQKK